ncbi:MAG: DUF6432 family protein [Halobacteriaceae archaeon]
MPVKREYRNRGETQTAVLEALVDRGEEGMTVLELRGRVDADIDDIEAALSGLKDDDLIVVESDDDRTVLKAADRVVAERNPEPETSVLDWLRERLGR